MQHKVVGSYKFSKKRNVLLLSTAFIFSKLNMCKYLQEGYHMREEDVFPVTHSGEKIACNNNKLSPMMLWHTAPDHEKTLHLQIDLAPEYRPRWNAHSFDDKRESDHHPWWDKTATRQWRALFASPVWSNEGGFVSIGNVVASDVWWGPALQQGLQALSPASLSLLRTVWAPMEGLCVLGVTQAVVVAILYMSRRCDVRRYRSCAGVVTCGLPLRGRSAVHPVALF